MMQRRRDLEIEGNPIPRNWEETIAACLAKDPAKRPQSVAEIAHRLQLAPQQRQTLAPPVVARPSKKKVILIAAAVICIIAVAAWYFGTRAGTGERASIKTPVPMVFQTPEETALSKSFPTGTSFPVASPAPNETSSATVSSPTAVDVLTLIVGSSVNSVAFSPDSTRILTGGADAKAKVWDAQNGKELLTLSVGSNNSVHVGSVAFSPDGTRVVTGTGEGTTAVWDAQSGKQLLTLKRGFYGVSSVAFSPDGTRIVTGSTDDTATVWHAQSGKELITLKGHSQGVNSVAFSPDATRIVTGSTDATAKVWDARTGKELLTLKGDASSVNSVAFSPDGTRIVTGGDDARAKVWDAQNGKELVTLTVDPSVNVHINSVAFSPDGRRIATGSVYATTKVWDAQSGEELITLKGHSTPVNSVAFSPDGTRIVTGSADHTAKVWEFGDRVTNAAPAQQPSPESAAKGTPNNVNPQKLTKVFVKKYGVSAWLPKDVFPNAEKLSNSDESFLQGQSWTGQTTVTFSSVREPLAKVYAECAAEHSPQAPSKTVQYKVLKPTWFVVSGDLGPEADASLGFYTKGVKKGGSIVIMHFQWREDDFPFSQEIFADMSRRFDGN